MIRIRQTERKYRRVLYVEYSYNMNYIYYESLLYTYGASPDNMRIDNDEINSMERGVWQDGCLWLG